MRYAYPPYPKKPDCQRSALNEVAAAIQDYLANLPEKARLSAVGSPAPTTFHQRPNSAQPHVWGAGTEPGDSSPGGGSLRLPCHNGEKEAWRLQYNHPHPFDRLRTGLALSLRERESEATFFMMSKSQ